MGAQEMNERRGKGMEAGRQLLYNAGYKAGYEDAQKEWEDRIKRAKRRREEKKKRQRYFIQQKICGILVIAYGWALLPWLDGDATAPVFFTIIGVCLVFSKEMVIMNKYFYDKKGL